jgi:hypothetical protein
MSSSTQAYSPCTNVHGKDFGITNPHTNYKELCKKFSCVAHREVKHVQPDSRIPSKTARIDHFGLIETSWGEPPNGLSKYMVTTLGPGRDGIPTNSGLGWDISPPINTGENRIIHYDPRKNQRYQAPASATQSRSQESEAGPSNTQQTTQWKYDQTTNRATHADGRVLDYNTNFTFDPKLGVSGQSTHPDGRIIDHASDNTYDPKKKKWISNQLPESSSSNTSSQGPSYTQQTQWTYDPATNQASHPDGRILDYASNTTYDPKLNKWV